jgi:hypothetical protein
MKGAIAVLRWLRESKIWSGNEKSQQGWFAKKKSWF